MRRTIHAVFLTAMLCGGVRGQSASELPTFEVASIKASQTPPGRGLASLREDINPSSSLHRSFQAIFGPPLRLSCGGSIGAIGDSDVVETNPLVRRLEA